MLPGRKIPKTNLLLSVVSVLVVMAALGSSTVWRVALRIQTTFPNCLPISLTGQVGLVGKYPLPIWIRYLAELI